MSLKVWSRIFQIIIVTTHNGHRAEQMLYKFTLALLNWGMLVYLGTRVKVLFILPLTSVEVTFIIFKKIVSLSIFFRQMISNCILLTKPPLFFLLPSRQAFLFGCIVIKFPVNPTSNDHKNPFPELTCKT